MRKRGFVPCCKRTVDCKKLSLPLLLTRISPSTKRNPALFSSFISMFFSRLLASAGALSLLLAPLAVANGASWDIPNVARNSGAIPGEFIVRLKDNVDVDALLAKHNLVKKQSYKNAIKGFSGKLSLAQQKKLLADPAVEFIEPDYIVTTMLPSYCRYFPPTFPGCGASSSSQQSSSSSSSEQPPSSSSLSSQPPTSSSSNSSQSSRISSSSSSTP